MKDRQIPVENTELLTLRDLRRELNTRMADLERGVVDKLVLTRHGEMIGVVLTIDDYAKLLKEADPHI